jgi:hypothetical protein
VSLCFELFSRHTTARGWGTTRRRRKAHWTAVPAALDEVARWWNLALQRAKERATQSEAMAASRGGERQRNFALALMRRRDKERWRRTWGGAGQNSGCSFMSVLFLWASQLNDFFKYSHIFSILQTS